jgi:hypothetical protein
MGRERLTDHEAVLQTIETELERVAVGPEDVGEELSIWVNDEEDGWASLGASEQRADFYWYGLAEEILGRLRGLPSGSGPEALKTTFRTNLPAAVQIASATQHPDVSPESTNESEPAGIRGPDIRRGHIPPPG